MLLLALAIAACQPAEQRTTGILLGVESTSIQHVDAFTLRDDEGKETRFIVSAEAARTAHAPSPSHLRQHMALGDRVTVRYRPDKDAPLALEVIDSK